MIKRFQKASIILRILVLIIALLMLSGWIFDIDYLKRPLPNTIAMNPLTAVTFIFSAISLFFFKANRSPENRILAKSCAIFVLLIGIIKFAGILFSFDTHIDQVLFRGKPDYEVAGYVNRMTTNTAFCFILTGTGLFLMSFQSAGKIMFGHFLATTVLLINLLSILGYIYNVGSLANVSGYLPMAIHTAFGFLFFSLATLFAYPDKGLMKAFTSPFDGSTSARKLVIMAVIVPIVLGFLRIYATITYSIPAEFGTAVLIFGIIILFLIFIYKNAVSINKKDFKRKVAEATLLANKKLLQSIIDNTTSFIYVKDLLGKYILVNNSYTKKFNISSKDIIGKTAYDLINHKSASELREQDEEVVRENKIRESEERVSIGTDIHDFFSVRFPLTNEEGNIYATGGIFTDITEVTKQGTLIKDLYDNAPCGYYSVDTNGIIINANYTTLNWLGYKTEELIGKSFADIIVSESIENEKRNFLAFKRDGYIYDKEFIYKRKDGSTFPVSLNASAVKNQSGEFLYSRSTIFDITERKKLEESLHITNKELESFTYSVSHDLRSPLRIINGYASMIKEEAACVGAEPKRMLENIITNVKQMGTLIDDLLNFSRLGRKELLTHDTDMNALVQPILEQQLNGNQGYNLNVKSLATCKCDSGMIKQVWENLISNSIKYSAKKPHPAIEIGSLEENNNTVYYIKDNGAGFDMKYYEKLFGVFQRLHKPSEFEGTGVGLALAQRIILKHGGKIWAESKINEGSTFYFTVSLTS